MDTVYNAIISMQHRTFETGCVDIENSLEDCPALQTLLNPIVATLG